MKEIMAKWNHFLKFLHFFALDSLLGSLPFQEPHFSNFEKDFHHLLSVFFFFQVKTT